MWITVTRPNGSPFTGQIIHIRGFEPQHPGDYDAPGCNLYISSGESLTVTESYNQVRKLLGLPPAI